MVTRWSISTPARTSSPRPGQFRTSRANRAKLAVRWSAPMSLFYDVLFASKCRSNHHRLALDALRWLRGGEAERWRNLFLHHHQVYLDGAKAPDEVFKDFKNHVLHVRDNYWGGAVEAAE